MKENIVKFLSCPVCGKPLNLKPKKRQNNEIKEGILKCAKGHRYPIVNFIPRLIIGAAKEYLSQHQIKKSFSSKWEMWPQFKSPLLWDVFAVSTYFTVSLMFWYVGLVPDMATMRDRAKTKVRRLVLGVLSMGWTGANRHWRHYEKAYLILAALATPLVLSVH